MQNIYSHARKGLTPIIAVVLLLMMTVAAAGLAYQFVIGTQTDVQDKVKNQLDTQLGASDIQWNVESGKDTTVGATPGTMEFTIRNTGKGAIAANSMTLYVDGIRLSATGPSTAVVSGSTGTISTAQAWPDVGLSKVVRMVHNTTAVSVSYTCTNNGGSAQDIC